MTDNTRPTAPHASSGYTPLNELIPRFGMFAGPNYAGGQSLGNTTPALSVWQTRPVNFLDEVTRYHDLNYTWNQRVYGEGTAQYDAARWQADKEMFQNVLAWKPPAGDFISTSYKQALIEGFSALGSRLLGNDQFQAEWAQSLSHIDPQYARPPANLSGFSNIVGGLFPALSTLTVGRKFELTGMSALTGAGMNVQQALLFNQHITSTSGLRNQVEVENPFPTHDNKIVIATRDPNNSKRFTSEATINGKFVKSELILAEDGLSIASFSRETFSGGTLVETQIISKGGISDSYGQSALNVDTTVYQGGTPTTTTGNIAAPAVSTIIKSFHTAQIEDTVISGQVNNLTTAQIAQAKLTDKTWRSGADPILVYGNLVHTGQNINFLLGNNAPTNISLAPDKFFVDASYNNLEAISIATGIPVATLEQMNPSLSANQSLAPGVLVNIVPVLDLLGITTNNAAPTPSQTPAPDATSSGPSITNNNLVSTGNYTVGIGNFWDVNTAAGNQALAGYAVTEGFRPGNNGIGLNINASSGIGLQIPGMPPPVNTNPAAGPVDYGLYASSVNNAAQSNFFQVPVDPLVLDLNGDGVKLTNFTDAPVLFDADNDGGSLEQTGWVSNEDGIVVHDLNNDGKINNISETLSEYYNGVAGSNGVNGTKPFANGFAALKSLDSNNDNQFTSTDAAWSQLKVWQDSNHDGKTDAGELKTFADLGITAINLNSTSQSGEVRDGNAVLARGTFTQTVNSVSTTREAIAANFIANPAGSTITQGSNGITVATEGVAGTGATSAYVSTNTVATVNESLTASTLLVKNITGGAGADTITGDALNNWLAGSLGADKLYGGAGDDVLLIDSQDTIIDGGAGLDIAQVVGNQGVTLNLSQSNIEIAVGGDGNDVFIGGGRSTVFVRGGAGDDLIIGGAANDVLSGEDGSDTIDGGAGNDLIRGHRGQDQLLGGQGDDVLDGGLEDSETVRNKKRSCLRTYLLGYRHKRLSKCAKKRSIHSTVVGS